MAAEQQNKPLPKFSAKEKRRLIFLLALGLILMAAAGLWQNQQPEQGASPLEQASGQPEQQADTLAQQLEATLSQVAGAGSVTVSLTYQDHGDYQYLTEENRTEKNNQQGSESTSAVTLAKSGGQGQPVLVNQGLPNIQGAVLIAEGGGDPTVKAALTEAAANLLGVGQHRITVLPKKQAQGGGES